MPRRKIPRVSLAMLKIITDEIDCVTMTTPTTDDLTLRWIIVFRLGEQRRRTEEERTCRQEQEADDNDEHDGFDHLHFRHKPAAVLPPFATGHDGRRREVAIPRRRQIAADGYIVWRRTVERQKVWNIVIFVGVVGNDECGVGTRSTLDEFVKSQRFGVVAVIDGCNNWCRWKRDRRNDDKQDVLWRHMFAVAAEVAQFDSTLPLMKEWDAVAVVAAARRRRYEHSDDVIKPCPPL